MPRTRAHDFEDKQKHILDTAASVFATVSMDKASMALIARKANISKALLYHYYSSKDELIFDIVKAQLRELETALVQATDDTLDPEPRLRQLIHAVVGQYENADDLHRVRLTYMNSLPEDMIEQIRDMERSIIRVFSDVLNDANPALADGNHYLMPATMTLFGSFNWIYTWFRYDGPMSREEYADLMTTIFLKGVCSVK